MARRVAPALVLCALLCAPASRAAYNPVKNFSRAEGLPGSRVLCLFQEPGGAVWAGTDNGAARYDGRRWRPYTVRDGLAGPVVWSITQDAEGHLWFGTSGGVSRFTGQFWDRLGRLEGMPSGGRLTAMRDTEGGLWFGTEAGLWCLDLAGNSLSSVREVPPRAVTSLFTDAEGRIWLTSEEGAASYDGRLWRELGTAEGFPPGGARSGLRDDGGDVWFAAPGGLVVYNGVSFRLMKAGDSGLPAGEVKALARDGYGRLWAGTSSGPAYYDGYRWLTPAGVEQWPDRTVNALLADSGGNLWLGTDSGLIFLDLSWQPLADESWDLRPGHPLLPENGGTLWCGAGQGAGRIEGRLAERWGAREGLEGELRALLRDGEGNVWLGTDKGAWCWDGVRLRGHRAPEPVRETVMVREGLWESRSRREPDRHRGLTGDEVNAFLQDEEGRIWVATQEGLSALEGDRWLLFPGNPALAGPVLSLAGPRPVFAGTASGLLAYEEGSWQDLTAGGGPARMRVNALLAEEGILWAGTDEGLWVRDGGGWRVIRQEEGLLSDRVTSMTRDPSGLLWVGTRAGLSIHDGVNWSSISPKEGLPAQEVLSVAGVEDGRLLVGGRDWAALYRPDRIPPETYVKNPPSGPVGAPQYLFEYFGADLLSEPFELRYSWRIDGGEWSPFTLEPLVTVSDLANGTHTFEVRAMDRGLNVDPTPAAAVFEVNTALFDVELRELQLKSLFASLYHHYASDFEQGESPVGTITLFNKYDRPLKVKVSLTIPRYMEFSTDRVISLGAREQATIPLRLEMEEAVLGQRENTVEQLLVSLQYHLQGELKENKFSRGVPLHGRNAMSWEDPRRVCIFASHLDPDLEAATRALAGRGKGLEEEFVADNNLIRAALTFNWLGKMGLRYLPDPEHPYTGLSASRTALDYIRYPRETLALGSGDCDDISVLYAACLQSIGLDAALVDVGDHVFVMVDTGLRGEERRLVSPDETLVHLDAEGRVWVPVETTMVGRPFTEAWKRASQEMNRRPLDIIVVKEAWKHYQPVLGAAEVPFPGRDTASEESLQATSRDLAAVEDALLGAPASRLREMAADQGDVGSLNRLGVAMGRKGYLRKARRYFEQVVAQRPGFAGGWANLGNVLYELGDHAAALAHYERAISLEPGNAEFHLELAMTSAEMGDFERARRHYLAAVTLQPELGKQPAAGSREAPH